MRTTGHRRELTREDLERMRVPERFWTASLSLCGADTAPATREEPETTSLQKMIGTYLRDLDRMLDRGAGLLLWGNNGRGKTAAMVVIGKECRRRGCSVLFTTAEGLRSAVLNKIMFDRDQGLFERALTVDVLLLDDLGKEHRDSGGFAASLFEDLVRQRSAARLTTLITTNAAPHSETFRSLYKHSMLQVMKESCMPVFVGGMDRRDVVAGDLKRAMGC